METEGRAVGARGWGRGRSCFVGAELQFGDVMGVMGGPLHNHINGLSASKLCTYVYFAIKKNLKPQSWARGLLSGC